MQKLAPQGLMLIHISNRHLDMEPVLAALTRHLGLKARLLHSKVSVANRKRFRFDAIWVAVARDGDTLKRFLDTGDWRPLQRRNGVRYWTDAYSNIISILK